MKQPGTMYTGPLGSTFHVLHAEPETVTALATIDWNRHLRRGCGTAGFGGKGSPSAPG